LDGTFTSPKIPLSECPSPTFTEATRPKEIQALLKFGRDLAWPLKITAASAIDKETSLSITYDSDWDDCDGTVEWIWQKFHLAAQADQIEVPPAFARAGSTWELCLRKENNSLHILVREKLVDGSFPVIPEDPELPSMIPYGPNAIIQ
jgi:hypothetical protein